MNSVLTRLALLVFLFSSFPILAEEAGRIEGRVTAKDGSPHGGVTVVIHETRDATLTDSEGKFAFVGVPPGTYTLIFTHATDSVTRPDVVVTADATTVADLDSAWEFTFVETLTVYSASRRQEKIVEAPAAVTVVSEEQIEREATHGQLPKLLEFTPGAEVTQSGIYDYNFNTRGFNSSLNRRVATLIDGRNPAVPFLGAQEWAAISFPLDDLASLELIRGPSAALYGANASSGVLNMTTKQPRYSQGGQLRVAGGDLSTGNVDFRYAGGLTRDWYWKVNAGLRDSGDFTLSRRFPPGAAEYSTPCPVPQGSATDCLPQELAALNPEDDNQIFFGGVRFDKYMDGGGVLSLETGMADIEGPVFQTGIGRVQLVDVKRPWGRINYSTDHWNFLTYYTGRDAEEQTALASGANLALDTENITAELQTNWSFLDERAQVVGGASYSHEDIDSLDPQTGLQTLMFEPVDADKRAVFGQLDLQVLDRLKLVFAARWDGSSLHDDQFSPKASVVYSIDSDHSLRFTYNEAFQVANYSEFFLNAPAAGPADLSTFEVLCLVNGVADCGLAGATLGGTGTPVLALGNDDLEVEETRTFEVGYSGIIAGKAFLTLDYYNSTNENFITDLVPNVGTPLGRVNPDFGPWAGSTAAETTPVTVIDLDGDMVPDIPPAFLGVPVAETVRQLCDASASCAGLLSNNLDGSNIVAARSYANFGDVDTQGADLGLKWFLDDRWNVAFSWSWFDFDIKEAAPGLESILLPNSPEHKGSVGVAFVGKRLDGSVSARWVDDFAWIVGPFQGMVESYTTVDLTGNYALNERWKFGISVANLLDDEHWEAFGGDLLERRALAHVLFSWD